MSETKEPENLTIAYIRKVQGRRGEVAAEILTDFPERFQAGQEMLLSGGGALQTLCLEDVWFHKGLAILKFRGIGTISAAETLVGRRIQIPLSERRPLRGREVYLSDLVGCDVIEEGAAGGGILGKVEAVLHTGAAPLLKVLTAPGELLIPFAEDICTAVDIGKKEIHVRLPEGLKELNQSTRGQRISGKQAAEEETAEANDARGNAGTLDD